jgi:hypothetical protein
MEKYNTIVFRRKKGEYQSIWKYDLLKKTKELVIEEDGIFLGNILYASDVDKDVFYYGAGYGATYIDSYKYDMKTKSSSEVCMASILKIVDKGKYKGCFVVETNTILSPCNSGRIYYYLLDNERFATIGCLYLEQYYGDNADAENEKFLQSINYLDYDNVKFVEPPHCDYTQVDSAYMLAKTGLQYITQFQQTRSIAVKNMIEQLRYECKSYMSQNYTYYDDIGMFPEELHGKLKTIHKFYEMSEKL